MSTVLINTPFVHTCKNTYKNLHQNLISEQNSEKLLNTLHVVHQSISSNCFIFESCLNLAEPNVDLAFKVTTDELDKFHHSFSSNEFISNCKNEKIFYFLYDFKKNEILKKNISGIWIGFDLRSTLIWPPEPNLYLDFICRPKETIEIIEATSRTLNDEKIATKTADLLRGFFSNEIYIFTVGFMLARSQETLRICSTSSKLLATNLYTTYLNAIGLHGATASFSSLLDRLRPFIDNISFDLDVGNQTCEKFGVSFYVSRKLLPAGRKKHWGCTLDILAFEGLVQKKKQTGVLEWCEYQLESETCSTHSLPWEPQKYLVRDISHIKVVFLSNKLIQAKAYLEVACRESEPPV